MKLVNNYRIRFAGILILTALRFGFTSSNVLAGVQSATLNSLLYTLLMSFVMSLIIWETNRAAVVYFNRRNPLGGISGKRFAKEVLLLLVVNAIAYALTMVYVVIVENENPPLIFMLFGFLDRFLYGMLVAAFYELLLFMEAWRKAMQEAEELKKVNLMVQLESLKNQVKPHFLFNSLNTLTGLVEQDTPRAVRFIAELSNVYRYLLQSNEKELIQLSNELQFTKAFFFLLQTRFGDGISLMVDVEEKFLTYLIPPLTVQLLVENAVKHNQVSVRKPLQVVIKTEEGNLVVENNLQPKRTAAPSNGMGLSNVAAKYKLLNQPDIIILSEEKNFIVKVPLIKPEPV